LKGKAFETEREGRGKFGSYRLGKEVRVFYVIFVVVGLKCV